jgi:hypothetical protein
VTAASAVDRLEELLALEATEGLEAAESEEVRSLLANHPEVDRHGFELAAAAVHLATPVAAAALLPKRLDGKLAALAEGFLASHNGSDHTATPAARDRPLAEVVPLARAAAPPAARFGWWVAAACLLLALVGWLPRLLPEAAQQTLEPVAEAPTPPAARPTPAQELSRRLAAASDTVELAWAATDDPAGRQVAGTMVWSGDLQQGLMRFRGLPANDPQQAQYQLWIFDAERDERFPVDGGVFDVATAEGETVVPIEAKLPVGEATLFAVTMEPPGGVVVSSREHIVALASVG